MVINCHLRSNAFNLAVHKPLHKVNGVNSLIHKRSAAVHFPCAAPAAVIVIFLSSVPLNRKIAEKHFSYFSADNRVVHKRHIGIISVLMNNARFHTCFKPCLLNSQSRFNGYVNRLFNKNIFARFHCFDGKIGVHSARNGNADGIDIGIFKHLVKIRIYKCFRTSLFSFIKPLRIQVANRDKIGIF